MIHAATPEYYREIQAELDDCEVVFYEGVRGRVARWITLAYRIPTWFFNLTGLVHQADGVDLSRKSDQFNEDVTDGLGQKVWPHGRFVSVRRTLTDTLSKRKIKSRSNALRTSTSFKVTGMQPDAFWSAMSVAASPSDTAVRRLIHADMSREAFEAGWRKLDWRLRAAILTMCPLVGILLAASSSFRKLVFEMQLESGAAEVPPQELEGPSESRRGATSPEELEELWDLLLNQRDKIMIEKIEAFWEAEPGFRGQTAGIFGAAHLPAIINHLVRKRGFSIVGSRWVMAVPAS